MEQNHQRFVHINNINYKIIMIFIIIIIIITIITIIFTTTTTTTITRSISGSYCKLRTKTTFSHRNKTSHCLHNFGQLLTMCRSQVFSVSFAKGRKRKRTSSDS